MKKLMGIITLVFCTIIMMECNNVYADQPKSYWSHIITSNANVGENISFEIGQHSETESISGIANGSVYYSEDIFKSIFAYSVNGTVEYDSSVLEYVDVTVSQKSGCCYESPIPKTTKKDGKIEISWDSREGFDWGYHDTILVNFKVISVPKNNETSITFSSSQGNSTVSTININSKVLTNKENTNEALTNKEDTNEALDNNNDKIAEKESIFKNDIIVFASIIGNVILLATTFITIICCKKSKKQNNNF